MLLALNSMKPGPAWWIDQRGRGLRSSEHLGLCTPVPVLLGGPGTKVGPLGPAQFMPTAHPHDGKMVTSRTFQISL